MTVKRDYVVLSDDWNGLPTSTMHLFCRVARDRRVFWLNLVNRMPRLSWHDARKVGSVMARWAARLGRVGNRRNDHPVADPKKLHVSTPFMVPWFKPPIRRMNRGALMRHYRRLCSRYAIHDPIIVTVFPSAVDFVRAVDARTKVYYCYDEFLEYPGFNPRDWRRMEEELLDAIDALVITSRDLSRKNRNACPTLYLPHGVDFEHFSRATAELSPCPEMERIRRPIVGFFGLISTWVDQGLIVQLSTAFPEVSFVLIGKAEVSIEKLHACPNVHCLGPVPYARLPQYARYFDVGLIPFLINNLTVAVNPLKLMEYLALGLPTLSSRLPELEALDGPVWLASTSEEFCDRLTSLLPTCHVHADSAVEVARRNSWDCRTSELSTFLENLA